MKWLLLILWGWTSIYAQEGDQIVQTEGNSFSRDAWTIYSYRPGKVYQVITEMQYISAIELALDDTEILDPAFGESSLFSIAESSGFNEEGQKIIVLYIKPLVEYGSTNAIITSNRRSYHLLLKESQKEGHMFKVRWTYPNGMVQIPSEDSPLAPPPFLGVINHEQLNFNYHIISVARKPYEWEPHLAFDDGIRTYIRFLSGLDIIETPVAFSVKKKEIIGLNFRISGNYYIIQGIYKELELRVPSDRRRNKHEIVRIVHK